jgi:hypothetical protein
MSEDGLREIRRVLEDELESAMALLARGMAKDYAEYKYTCGAIALINTLTVKLDELEKRWEKEDE